jgi:dephospho-CoA kinase
MVIGVTGNYCSGKDVACSLFEESGFQVIDVDRIGHEALITRKDEIVRCFGSGILSEGAVDRKKLGGMVFSSSGKREMLEKIVHPWMIREVRRRVSHNGSYVINAALLIEMCLHVLCDFVLALQVREDVAVSRAMARNGLSREEALLRIRAQIPTKEKLHLVDKVIDNNGVLVRFTAEVRSVIDNLR